jgi:hypothetical protein
MNTFGKQSGCPSSERVLEFIKKLLSRSTARRVELHIASCDFCGAETLFMAKHAATYGDYRPSLTTSRLQTVLMSKTIYQNEARRAA